MFLAFCVSVPFGITGYLGDDYGAICIGVVLLVLVCIVVGWLAKVFRTANHVIDKNDPKSKLNRSE